MTLKLENISKKYTLGNQVVTALDDVSLTISSGDFMAIAGPSGSGKSTLLNLVSLIDNPTSGNITYDGINVASYSDNEITKFRNQKIGIVFQSYNLIPVLDAVENVAFALQLQKKTKKESVKLAKLILEEVGLKDHLNHRPSNLSGGQRQRVAIARALVTNPEIVIADEPTAALDSKTGIAIIELMKSLNEKKNTTFIFSTHDPKIIKKVNSVVHLLDGQIDKKEETKELQPLTIN